MYNGKSLNLREKFIIKYLLFLLMFFLFSLMYILQLKELEYICIGFIIILGLLPLIKMALKKRLEPLTPNNIIPFTYMLYALGPLFYRNDFSQGTIESYLILQSIGLLGLMAGLNLPRRTLRLDKLKIKQNSNNIILITGGIIFILSILSVTSEVVAFRGIGNLLKIGYGIERIGTINNSILIGGGFQWLLLSGIIIWYYSLKTNSKKALCSGIFISALAIIFLLLTGGRSTIIYNIIFASVLYYYEKRYINNKLILFSLVVGIVIAQFYSASRYFFPQGFIYAMGRTWEILVSNPAAFIPVPWNINEFKIPGRSLMEILEYGGPSLQLGKTYISALGAPIPFIARLTSNIGMNPSRWLLSNYHPEVLAVGGGNGFSPIAEGYINFGTVGPLFHMFVYGLVISGIYNNYKKNKTTSSLLLYAGALPLFMLDGLRIHLASFTYKLFRIYLLPFIVFVLINMVKRSGKTTAQR